MPQLDIYQVDAFAEAVFKGNPAAVIPLECWLPDEQLQAIAEENNLAETAFFVPMGDRYDLRWFTPTQEVPLCGHATLAAAHIIVTKLDSTRTGVSFQSPSGELGVKRRGDLLELDFPAASFEVDEAQKTQETLCACLGRSPETVLRVEPDPNLYAVFSQESDVVDLEPDLVAVAQLHPYGLVVTAPGDSADFVSRYFAPSYGISEDAATGSIHCALIPFWGQRLGKATMTAQQRSRRGATLYCGWNGERVTIGGQAVTYLEGTIAI